MFALVFLLPALTRAQPITIDALESLAGDLRSDDSETRAVAIDKLSTLPVGALEAIDQRIVRTRRQMIEAEDGYDALRAIRHAMGSLRADDMVDIAEGIPTALAERRTRTMGRVAERVLLIRSLERLGTVDAQRRIADVFSLTNEMWRWEARRLVGRMGMTILPGLILARGHDDRGVRVWARGHIERLGMKNPADALTIDDPELLGQVIEAYTEIRDLDTMPVIISYVGHEDARVREAARKAFETFGRNGIWQLREGLRNQLGQRADARWGWRRTMRELYEGLDEQRMAPFAGRVDEALEAVSSGDYAAARTKLDELLLAAPEPPRVNDVGDAYARLSEELDDLSLLRRAVWLAPDHPDVSQWRGRLELAQAEADRERGFVDPDAYREALRLDPSETTRGAVADVLGDDEADEIVPVEESSSAGLWLLGLLLTALIGVAGAYRLGQFRPRSRIKLPRRIQRLLGVLRGKRSKSAGRSIDVLQQMVFHPPQLDTSAEPKAVDAGLIFGLSDASATVKQTMPQTQTMPHSMQRMPTDTSATVKQAPPAMAAQDSPDTLDEAMDEAMDEAPNFDTEPGVSEVTPAPLSALLFQAPEKVDTLPGAPVPSD